MNRATRIAVTIASSACLIVGFASAAGASPFDFIEASSNINSQVTDPRRVRIYKNDDVRIRTINNNLQFAHSGNASSLGSIDGSDTITGSAENFSDTVATVIVDTEVLTSSAVNAINIPNYQTKTDIEVSNSSSQTAITGDATSTGKRDAGSVSSGIARNNSLTTFEIKETYQ